MSKRKCIQLEYTYISSKDQHILFGKTCLDGLHLKILKQDPTLNKMEFKEVSQQQIQKGREVYDVAILANQYDSLKTLKIFGGWTALKKHLKNEQNWVFDIEQQIFSIFYVNKKIQQFDAKKNYCFSIFQLEDIQNNLNQMNFKGKAEQEIVRSQLVNLLAEQNSGRDHISQSTVLQRRKQREKKIQKQKQLQQVAQKLNKIQNEIKSSDAMKAKSQSKIVSSDIRYHIALDSFGLFNFNFQGLSIIKQQNPDQRFVFGKQSIKDYSYQYTFKLDKLSTQKQNSVIWLGIADPNERSKESMLKQMNNVFVMCDKQKIYGCTELNKQKKIFYKDRNNKALGMKIFEQGDTITVKLNPNTGEIQWLNQKGVELGFHASEILKTNPVQNWVFFIQLWKIGDRITYQLRN